MIKQTFIINNLLEATETPVIKPPFSLIRAINKSPNTSIVQIFSVAVDPLNDNDPYYNKFKSLVAALEQLMEEPQSNIPHVLSYGVTETGSYPFIEMNYIKGESIKSHLSSHTLINIDEIIKITRTLSRTLAHCHNLNIIHGNISDKNIIYSHTDDKYILTGFGLFVLTPEMRREFYDMAFKDCVPAEVRTGALLPQSDIYDFGCLLYKLITGSAAHDINKLSTQNYITEINRLRNTITSTAKESDAELDIPIWLCDLVYKCLQKDPDLRFNNGVELYDFILFNNLPQPKKLLSKSTEDIRTNNKVTIIPAKADFIAEDIPTVNNQPGNTRYRVISRKKTLIGIAVFLMIIFAGLLVYTANSNKNRKAIALSPTTSVQQNVIKDNTITETDKVTNRSPNSARLRRSESIIVNNNNLAKGPITPGVTAPAETMVIARHTPTEGKNVTTLIHPWKPEGSTLDMHNGMGGYRVISKAYFYNSPDVRTRRRAFIVHWNNVLLKPVKEQSEFIYIVYTNSLGQTSKGWLRKKDLLRAQK